VKKITYDVSEGLDFYYVSFLQSRLLNHWKPLKKFYCRW